jgi:hypothetical protein
MTRTNFLLAYLARHGPFTHSRNRVNEDEEEGIKEKKRGGRSRIKEMLLLYSRYRCHNYSFW